MLSSVPLSLHLSVALYPRRSKDVR